MTARCADQDEDRDTWTGVLGQKWGGTWTSELRDGETWEDFAVQIRRKSDRALIASTGPAGAADGVIQLVTTGTNLTADPMVFAWESAAVVTGVPTNEIYWIGMQATVNGVADEFLEGGHQWWVVDEWVYGEAS